MMKIVTGMECSNMFELHNNLVEWDEFIYHDVVSTQYWSEIYEKFPQFQFSILDGQTVVATGNSIPLSFENGVVEYNNRGWDWALEKGFEDLVAGRIPTTLCGLQIGIAEEYKGKGISSRLIEQMRTIAAQNGFRELILPIRPTLKSRYPLIRMEDYIEWKNSEELPYDPWIRAHMRFGAEIISVCNQAMFIQGSVREWELWTGLTMQSSGEYIVKGALVPLSVNVESDEALYTEPNVWMRHKIR